MLGPRCGRQGLKLNLPPEAWSLTCIAAQEAHFCDRRGLYVFRAPLLRLPAVFPITFPIVSKHFKNQLSLMVYGVVSIELEAF